MLQHLDAILTLGGGIKGKNTLPEWSKRRLDKAVELFSGSEYIITIGGGTVYKPHPLDKRGFPIYDSIVTAKYLLKKGISSRKILTETASLDTIGNIYFTRVIHTDPGLLKNLAVITSNFHMPRIKAICQWVFSLPPLLFQYSLNFIEVDDQGIDRNMIRERRVKERRSLKQLLVTQRKIKTLKALHDWLFSEHKAYALGKVPGKLTGEILKSY